MGLRRLPGYNLREIGYQAVLVRMDDKEQVILHEISLDAAPGRVALWNADGRPVEDLCPMADGVTLCRTYRGAPKEDFPDLFLHVYTVPLGKEERFLGVARITTGGWLATVGIWFPIMEGLRLMRAVSLAHVGTRLPAHHRLTAAVSCLLNEAAMSRSGGESVSGGSVEVMDLSSAALRELLLAA